MSETEETQKGSRIADNNRYQTEPIMIQDSRRASFKKESKRTSASKGRSACKENAVIRHDHPVNLIVNQSAQSKMNLPAESPTKLKPFDKSAERKYEREYLNDDIDFCLKP